MRIDRRQNWLAADRAYSLSAITFGTAIETDGEGRMAVSTTETRCENRLDGIFRVDDRQRVCASGGNPH